MALLPWFSFRLLVKVKQLEAHSLTPGAHLSPTLQLGVRGLGGRRGAKAVGFGRRGFREPQGTNTGGMVAAERGEARKLGKEQDQCGERLGQDADAPVCSSQHPRASRRPRSTCQGYPTAIQRTGSEARPAAPVLWLWPTGSSKSVLLSCHGNLSAEAPKGRGREGRWERHVVASLEKPICCLPRKPSWGEKQERNRQLGLDREGGERPQEAPRAAFLTGCVFLPLGWGTSLTRIKVWVGPGEGICAGGRVGPVASGLGGSPRGPVSAAAGFLLGGAVNLNGVLPHCVFLFLEDPGRGEGRVSAAEKLLGTSGYRPSGS